MVFNNREELSRLRKSSFIEDMQLKKENAMPKNKTKLSKFISVSFQIEMSPTRIIELNFGLYLFRVYHGQLGTPLLASKFSFSYDVLHKISLPFLDFLSKYFTNKILIWLEGRSYSVPLFGFQVCFKNKMPVSLMLSMLSWFQVNHTPMAGELPIT